MVSGGGVVRMPRHRGNASHARPVRADEDRSGPVPGRSITFAIRRDADHRQFSLRRPVCGPPRLRVTPSQSQPAGGRPRWMKIRAHWPLSSSGAPRPPRAMTAGGWQKRCRLEERQRRHRCHQTMGSSGAAVECSSRNPRGSTRDVKPSPAISRTILRALPKAESV
jgi:hypothetical protein